MDLQAVEFLATPFVACLVLVGIHAYLGIHVLARGVIFVDIALAQIAALGTTVAFLAGWSLDGPAAYLFSLGFTVLGAAVFAATGRLRRVSPEAVIGITYAVAAAAAIVFVDRAPNGAEHIKYILVGNLLWVSWSQVAFTAALYAALGLFHFVFRRRFLALSLEKIEAGPGAMRHTLWDFAFYVSFGIVITSAVQIAGVLMVFAFLIVPAVVAALFFKKLWARLLLSWGLGALVSAIGVIASYLLDLPTGATVVTSFGIALVLSLFARAGLARAGLLTHAPVEG